MYLKCVLVTLLPITLARNFLYARPRLWTHVDPGRQFHFRNPDIDNFGVRHGNQDRQYGTTFGDYRPYQEEYHDRHEHYERYQDHNTENINMYKHGNVQQADQDTRNIGQADYRNSEYQIQNDNRRETQLKDNDNLEESYYTNKQVNSNQSGNRRHHVNSNLSNNRELSRAIDSTHNNRKATLKTNVDSQTTTYSESPSVGRTSYHFEDITSSYDQNEYDRINEDAKRSKPVSVDQSSVVQSSVPEVKFTPRIAESREPYDNLPGAIVDNDSISFANNPESIASVKTTTDNEIKLSKSEGNDRREDEKWIWTETLPSTTTVPSKKASTAGDLDDRVSFAGDMCPKGEAKVLKECVPIHKSHNKEG